MGGLNHRFLSVAGKTPCINHRALSPSSCHHEGDHTTWVAWYPCCDLAFVGKVTWSWSLWSLVLRCFRFPSSTIVASQPTHKNEREGQQGQPPNHENGSPPAQNHVHHCHHCCHCHDWLDTMVPPQRIACICGGQGRFIFVSFYLGIDYGLSYSIIYYISEVQSCQHIC